VKVCPEIKVQALLCNAKASTLISSKIFLIFSESSDFLKSNHSNFDLKSAVFCFT
jgi:hypothetical protein